MTQTEIAKAAQELAAQVLNPDALPSFLALPLKDQLTGIAVFASMAGDPAVKASALEALRDLEAAEAPPVVELCYVGVVEDFDTIEEAQAKARELVARRVGSDLWVNEVLTETRYQDGTFITYGDE